MTKEEFILNILKKIESLKNGVIAYSYLTGGEKYPYWQVTVSDFDLYMKNKRFKSLTDAWYKAAKARGFKIIFVCGWKPKEKVLVKLAEADNLILNI